MLGEAVTVYVERGSSHDLEAQPSSLQATGSFDVRLQCKTGPAHVHCKLVGDLDDIAHLEETNFYVEEGRRAWVPVLVDTEAITAPIEGGLEISIGYGSIETTIDVTILPDAADRVAVAEELDTTGSDDVISDSDGSSPSISASVAEGSGVDPAAIGVGLLVSVTVLVASWIAAAVLGGTAGLLLAGGGTLAVLGVIGWLLR